MENLIIFVAHHWLLVSAFLIVAIVTIWYETQGAVNGLTRIDTHKAIHLINKENAIIFDIRDRSLFEKGHIAHAQNMTESQIDNYAVDKHKNQPVIIVCSTGATAPRLGKKLKDRGVNPVYFLQGGMGAWSQASLPVVKK